MGLSRRGVVVVVVVVVVVSDQRRSLTAVAQLQIRMLAGRATARATALPISEARVDAWLGKSVIRADAAQQLLPTRQALRAAEILCTGLATEMSQQLAHCPQPHATAMREPVSVHRGTRAALVARDVGEQAYRAQQSDLRL
jgi:hypothetical protein